MPKSDVEIFLKDIQTLKALPTSSRHESLLLKEYPFDGQLLKASSLYRRSRELYLSLGGIYNQRLCSTMRALSAQDLFKDEIDFTPSYAELLWFQEHFQDVSQPEAQMKNLMSYNEISLYHEQNHRILWRLLPPAPQTEKDVCRYLNFAESLVVTLDLALGDQLGRALSPVFERLKVIYRSGGNHKEAFTGKQAYRQYLMALLCTTYFALETLHNDDILKAVNYVLPGQAKVNAKAVRRGLELSELFSRVTNPEWQSRHWKASAQKLRRMHEGSELDPLYLPEDPLDLEEELVIARNVFDFFGL